MEGDPFMFVTPALVSFDNDNRDTLGRNAFAINWLASKPLLLILQ